MGRNPKRPTPNGKNKGQTLTVACSYPVEVSPKPLTHVVTRCPHGGCTRVLFKGVLGPGTYFEIQCPSCRGYTVMAIT